MQPIHSVLSAAAMTAAPLTGDAGFGPIKIVAIVGIVLICAFVVLSILQKKRKSNFDQSDN